MKKIPKDQVKRILIIRPDAIGDAVLTLSAVKSIREAFPNAYIAYLGSSYNARFLKHVPYIDEILVDNHSLPFNEYRQWIKSYNFDAALHCKPSTKTAWACHFAGIPYNLGSTTHIGLYPVFGRFGSYLREFDPTLHTSDFYFELLKPLGITYPADDSVPYLDPSEAALTRMQSFLEKAGRRFDKPLITIQVGVGSGNRPLTPEKYAKYIKLLATKADVDVCLTGYGDSEYQDMKTVETLSGVPILFHHGFPMDDVIALIHYSSLFVSVDTGPFHFAAALRIPQLAIFTTKRQKPSRWAPVGNRHFIVRASLGCLHQCAHTRCQYTVCTDEISPADMVEKTLSLLQGGGVAQRDAQYRYWIKTGFPIGILYDAKTEADAKSFQKSLLSWGFHPLLHMIDSPDLFDFLRQNDILIMHNLTGRKRFTLWIIAKKLQSFLIFAGHVVNNAAKTEDELFTLYRHSYEKRWV